MSNEALLSEAVKAYLAAHFGEVEIKNVMAFERDGHGFSFLIEADGTEYRLNVLDKVVVGLDRDRLIALFNDDRVASVMQDLIGFPVTLTTSGCIFD